MSLKNQLKRAKRIASKRDPNASTKQYTLNLYDSAHRTLRGGEAPPKYDGISNEEMLRVIRESREFMRSPEMQKAVAEANARLEVKPHQQSEWYPLQGQGLGQRRSPAPRREFVQDAAVLVPEEKCFIPEADLLAGIAEARAAGRTQLTPEKLAELLAHTVVSYRSQRGFVKGL